MLDKESFCQTWAAAKGPALSTGTLGSTTGAGAARERFTAAGYTWPMKSMECEMVTESWKRGEGMGREG